MKKQTKRLLTAAFVFLIIGLAFCISSVCLGFNMEQFQSAVNKGRILLTDSAGRQESAQQSSISVSDTEYVQAYKQVENLELELGVAECRLILYDGTEWKVCGSDLPSDFSSGQSGNTLKISSGNDSWKFWERFGRISSGNDSDPLIEIYIPETQILNRIEIQAGVGSIETRGGMLRCSVLELDCGVGACELQADISERLEADGGVGELSITLAGKEEDFDYDIECGIGEISIGDTKVNELGSEYRTDRNAGKKITADCGIGAVEFLFKKQEE